MNQTRVSRLVTVPKSTDNGPNPGGQAPTILGLPIDSHATAMRNEFDCLRVTEVPATRSWGAQAQRSLEPVTTPNDLRWLSASPGRVQPVPRVHGRR